MPPQTHVQTGLEGRDVPPPLSGPPSPPSASAPGSDLPPAAHRVRNAAREAAAVQRMLHAGDGLPARPSAVQAHARLQFGDMFDDAMDPNS
ncbi:MAG: hypothetical protein Q8L39_01980 [Burkholderiales bacterium]|nr:hypothetical protein [Burkholderiales bacterium]